MKYYNLMWLSMKWLNKFKEFRKTMNNSKLRLKEINLLNFKNVYTNGKFTLALTQSPNCHPSQEAGPVC